MKLEKPEPTCLQYKLPDNETALADYNLVHLTTTSDHFFDTLLKIKTKDPEKQCLLVAYKSDLCKNFGYFQARASKLESDTDSASHTCNIFNKETISDGREVIEIDLPALEQETKLTITSLLIEDFFKSMYRKEFKLFNEYTCGVYYFLSQYFIELNSKNVNLIKTFCKHKCSANNIFDLIVCDINANLKTHVFGEEICRYLFKEFAEYPTFKAHGP